MPDAECNTPYAVLLTVNGAVLEGFSQAQPTVSGEELMWVFNLTAVREIGELKRRAVEAVIEGEIENERDAILEYLLEPKN